MESILLKEAIIMANSNMCRLCLSANGITEAICYDQQDQFLLQKIYECTTIQITPLVGVPSALCTICKSRLEEFYQFRWQCIKNDEIIKRIADNMPKQSPGTEHSPKHDEEDRREIQQVSQSRGEYDAGEREQTNERTVYQHREHSHAEQQLEEKSHLHYQMEHQQQSTGSYHHGHTPASHNGFQMESKYGGQTPSGAMSEGSEFRRKRGRPPKQKYEFYPYPIVKYGDSSMESVKTVSSECSSVPEEPDQTLPTYGESSSRGQGMGYATSVAHPPERAESAAPGPYDSWPLQKIKLEQTEYQHPTGRYDRLPRVPSEGDRVGHPPAPTAIQIVPTPEGFVKRNRGRPPREGGCPNQDRNEYRFHCQYCNAKFKAAINLKLHTNTHTGEKPYKCMICDKSFAHPSNLSVHTKLHTQDRIKREGGQTEKKFQCPYCHTLFALAFQLKIHINTHTGQKPYVCKNCSKGFAQPSNLHVHIKKHCHKRMGYGATVAGSEQPTARSLPQSQLLGPTVAPQQLAQATPVLQQQPGHHESLHHHLAHPISISIPSSVVDHQHQHQQQHPQQQHQQQHQQHPSLGTIGTVGPPGVPPTVPHSHAVSITPINTGQHTMNVTQVMLV